MNTYFVYEDVADYGFPIEADSFKDAAEKFGYMLASERGVVTDTVLVRLGSESKYFECSAIVEVVAREFFPQPRGKS